MTAMAKPTLCSRGHAFEKSRERPVCPLCWPGYYKPGRTGLPKEIGAPALRALLGASITTLALLAKHTEKEIFKLHGVGPKAIRILKSALKREGRSFKK